MEINRKIEIINLYTHKLRKLIKCNIKCIKNSNGSGSILMINSHLSVNTPLRSIIIMSSLLSEIRPSRIFKYLYGPTIRVTG